MVLFCYVGMLCARAESVNRKIASGTWCELKANVLSSAFRLLGLAEQAEA